MTDTTHTLEPGTALNVDPQQLVIAANVRRNVALDHDFVDSVREHGILVPISVWWDDIAAAWQVLDGQRRTLAAREAGLTAVPVWIVPAIAGEDQRITQQLTVNDRRKSLDDAEETAAVHHLALFGLTADTIRRRTSIPKARVEQALAVAANPAAQQLLTDTPVTLEHAAALAEFVDNPELVERLTKIATTSPGILEHEITRAREDAARTALAEAEKQRLRTAGYTVMEDYPAHGGGWARVMDLVHDDGNEVDDDEITPDTASAYVQVYSTWVTPQGRDIDEDGAEVDDDDEIESAQLQWVARTTYFTDDPAKHGWKSLYGWHTGQAAPVVTIDEKRAARARTADWKAATTARCDFLRALVANKITTVRQPAALMLIALHAGALLPARNASAATYTVEWLGTAPATADRDYSDYHGFGAYLEKNPTRAINLALTLALTDIEDALAGGTLKKPQETVNPKVARYLTALTVLGHILTPIEQRAAGITPEPGPDELEQDA